MTDAPPRALITQAAADLLARLQGRHGALMFHQSGGCCDGSAPMCFTQGFYIVGPTDVHLGDLDIGPDPDVDPAGIVPVHISREQFNYWSHTHITIDVVPGRGAGFSIEGPTGNRFIIRSRIFTEEETELLAGEPAR